MNASPKPWWQSRTLIGALTVVVATLAGLVGLDVDEAGAAELATALLTLAGAGLACYGRLRAERPIRRPGAGPVDPTLLGLVALLCAPLLLGGCQSGVLAGAGEALNTTVQSVQGTADAALERTDRVLCTAYTERAISAHFGPPGLPRRDLYDAFCAPYRMRLAPPPVAPDATDTG